MWADKKTKISGGSNRRVRQNGHFENLCRSDHVQLRGCNGRMPEIRLYARNQTCPSLERLPLARRIGSMTEDRGPEGVSGAS
eukprot:3311745-Pleurochrysis_carterae.AAC.5